MSNQFFKKGVLLIHDCKFISGGRILAINEKIQNSILKQIQEQILYVMFPAQYSEHEKLLEKSKKYETRIKNLEGQVKNLKKINKKMSNKISVLESKEK